LVLILARRLRAVTERVNMLLPPVQSTLPHPGTPVPDFDAVSAEGEHLSRGSFAGVDRIFAVLSTDCGACDQQVTAFQKLEAGLEPPPIVAIVGAPEERAAMAAELDGSAVVIAESDTGPVVEAFEISEFPAVLLVRDAVIQRAGHELPSMVAELMSFAASAPAGSPRQS